MNSVRTPPPRIFARAAPVRRYAVHAWRCALLLVAAVLTGCASLPDPALRPPSFAADPAPESTLVQIAERSTPPDAGGRSGFRLLADGDHALDARLALIERAQDTLDIQYYLIADDTIGRRFAGALAEAAARGVRVRLLVDDLFAGESQSLLERLAARPNVEVRIFNPLPARGVAPGWRVLRSMHEFERINRRMHNKLFIADSVFAVSGGRNIADDYFMRGGPSNFIDMDVLASGPIVSEMSALFDRFWNGEQAWPLQDLAGAATPPLDSDTGNRTVRPTPFDRFGNEPVSGQLDAGWLELRFAHAKLLADSPEKADAGPDTAAPAALEAALDHMLEGRREVLIATPYLVPGARGLAMMRRAVDNGVHLVVMTNSYAATDEPLVHWGYARYRHAMLDLGVELHELSPTLGRRAAERGESRSSLGRLHAKLAVIDRERVLIGSMNMDARSMRSNTEVALLIESPALAEDVARTLARDRETSTYRLRTRAARIEWIANEAGREHVHETEPDAGWLTRLRLELLSLFVDEMLL